MINRRFICCHRCCRNKGFQDATEICVAGHPLQNNPLYLETFQQAGTGSEGALRFHYIVHCSLDAVEEKCKLSESFICLHEACEVLKVMAVKASPRGVNLPVCSASAPENARRAL